MLRYPVLTAVLACASLSSQSTNVVFPSDRATLEGANNNVFPLSRTSMRYQQLELQAKGRSFALRGIEFRRDGISTTNMAARTVTATILIGNGNSAAFGTVFSSNWVGTPTTVVSGQAFNLPALPRPATPPAQFLVKFPFAMATGHTGQHELLWEMSVTSRSSAQHVNDAHSTATATGTNRILGLGCTTSGSSRFRLTNSLRATLAQTELVYGGIYAPASAPVIALIGAVNPDVQLPGVCTKLHTLPLVTVALATSTSAGTVPSQRVQIGPWNPVWVRGKLYSQAFAPDASKAAGFALSDGVELTMPSTGPQAEAQRRLFGTFSTVSFGRISNGFGLVVHFP